MALQNREVARPTACSSGNQGKGENRCRPSIDWAVTILTTFKRKRRRKWEVTPPTIDETPPTIDDVTDVSPPTIDDVTDMFDQWRAPVIDIYA